MNWQATRAAISGTPVGLAMSLAESWGAVPADGVVFLSERHIDRRPEMPPGVYVMTARLPGGELLPVVKLGSSRTGDFERRAREIEGSGPLLVEPAAYHPLGAARAFESWLHIRFRPHHARREWFTLPEPPSGWQQWLADQADAFVADTGATRDVIGEDRGGPRHFDPPAPILLGYSAWMLQRLFPEQVAYEKTNELAAAAGVSLRTLHRWRLRAERSAGLEPSYRSKAQRRRTSC